MKTLYNRSSLLMFIVSTVATVGFFFFSPMCASASEAVAAQECVIRGTISDSQGNPVVGASVYVKGTSKGVSTDTEGCFALETERGATLVVSSIGFRNVEYVVGDKAFVELVLEEDSTLLDEIVVMAYNSTVKRKIISSVTNVDVKQVEQISGYKDMANALQGRVAGVIITNSSGGPDSTPNISIRGGGDPMYIIDGIVQNKTVFLRLSSQDIETISVMKDAVSCAVYGASAANGIIVVTTKKGKEGKMQIGYTFDGQYNMPVMIREKLNSLEYAELHNNISDYMGSVKPYDDDVMALIKSGTSNEYPDTDWWNLLVKDVAFSQRHTVTMSGGTKDTQYRASFMLYDQGSLQRHIAGEYSPLDYNMYTINFNLTHNFRQAGIMLSLNIRPHILDNRKYGNGSMWGDDKYGIQILSPLEKVFNQDGSYSPNSPMARFADTNGAYIKKFKFGTDFTANLEWNVPWVKGLKGVFWGNYNLSQESSKTWTDYVPTYNEDGSQVDAPAPDMNISNGYGYVYEFNAGLRYSNTFGRHGISAGIFYNQRENYNMSVGAKRVNYFNHIDELFAGPMEGMINSGSAAEGGRLGVVATLNYDFGGKYLISFSGRYDGNDGFAEGRRWGFFPSGAIGYNIAEEKFMEVINRSIKLDMFKFRASIGQIGMTSSRFEYLPDWNVDQSGAYVGGALVPSISPATLVSKDLTWYTTTTWNVGVDFAFLDSRLSGTADYFLRRTFGYLIYPKSRYNSTLGNQIGKSGNLYTYGLPKVKSDDAFRRAGAEFSLNWQDKAGDFTYSIGANLTFYDQLWEKYEQGDDEITILNPAQRTTYKTINQGSHVYVYDGLFRNMEELLGAPVQDKGNAMMPGDVKYVDLNGDGRISGEDKEFDHKPTSAIMQWGLPFSFAYKGWSLEGLIQGSGPRWGYITNNVRGTGWNKIYYKDQLDIFYPGNEDAVYPRADNDYGVWNGEMNRANSALWRINRTYARLKNLCLRYDFKYSLLKQTKWLRTCSIGVTGTNLLTICPSLKYADPEMGTIGSIETYPITRTLSVVLNVGF